MKHVTFAEYQAAKNEVIGGVEYRENSELEGNTIRKTYATEENGVFYEVNNDGRIEFWSDKQAESRIYDENEAVETAAALPSYGTMLAEKIRTETTDFSKLTAFEKFTLDNGYKFKTEEALRAGYDRAWKCSRDILITESEFITEAGEYYEPETLKAAYAALAEMVEKKKITASEVYRYAYYKWCLRNPEAIVAYEEGRDKWVVNDCDTEVSEDEAKIAVNSEWGFEASRIKIIGKPYYDATDYQYIRFDCAHMTWLWKNGNLYQVYA